MDNYIFINPSHGNEPYILGSSIAQRLSENIPGNPVIVVPNLYPARQKRILNEHIGIGPILDSTLGELFQPLLFSDGDFSKHVTNTLVHRQEVENKVRKHLLDNYGKPLVEINTGSKISVGDEIYYAFPCILSELLERTTKDGFGPRLERLNEFAQRMRSLESRFKSLFIPSYNTFSFDEERQPHPREISTPPLKSLPTIDKSEVPERTVYCMISGTGSETDSLLRRAGELQDEGYNMVVSNNSGPNTDYSRLPPTVISNPNVVKVIGRAGWGTMWLCQQAGKEFETIPYTPGDDPEIYFNVKTLEHTSLQEATARQKREFENMDGIDFVAERILKSM